MGSHVDTNFSLVAYFGWCLVVKADAVVREGPRNTLEATSIAAIVVVGSISEVASISGPLVQTMMTSSIVVAITSISLGASVDIAGSTTKTITISSSAKSISTMEVAHITRLGISISRPLVKSMSVVVVVPTSTERKSIAGSKPGAISGSVPKSISGSIPSSIGDSRVSVRGDSVVDSSLSISFRCGLRLSLSLPLVQSAETRIATIAIRSIGTIGATATKVTTNRVSRVGAISRSVAKAISTVGGVSSNACNQCKKSENFSCHGDVP